MFTLVYLDYDQDYWSLSCRIFEDPEIMSDWVENYYANCDDDSFRDHPPIMVFPGQATPLKCKWAMILEPDDPPPKTRIRKVRE
jgi:hypothetical protein